MASKKSQAKTSQKLNTVIAREDDGTIQLTLNIPKDVILQAENEVLQNFAKEVNIPGFRPGKAPLEEVKKHVSAQTVLEQLLAKVIPPTYNNVLKENDLRPILTPKFELVSAQSGSDWQVRAITCEVPKVELGEYKQSLSSIKKELEAAKATNSLWVPGKGEDKDKKELSQEEKENLVLDTLLKTAKVTMSKLLVEEEVNHRLAGLLDQTQKLGMTVDEYLARTGRNVEDLKKEYTQQAQTQLKAMIVLSHVAQQEGVSVSEEEVNEVIKQDKENKEEVSETQKDFVRSVLLRRRALDRLSALV